MSSTASIFKLPVLPYSLNALEPQISHETMEYHYGKHLKAYISNLNSLLEGSKFEGASLEDIIRYADGPIFNNGAQTWNHIFFFASLSPNPKKVPTGIFGEAVNRDFGSFDAMKESFFTVAKNLFGSGWIWLVKDSAAHLLILPMTNAGNPLTEGYVPLMCADVWEHAYYIDYRNKRADAVEAMWERTDWRIVEDRFRKG